MVSFPIKDKGDIMFGGISAVAIFWGLIYNPFLRSGIDG